MTVTTGARGCSASSLSSSPRSPTSTSASETRRRRWPNSATTSSAVSASMTWLIVAMTPMRISALITSAPRSAMRLASSWTVIVSGTTTSRTTFAVSCSRWCRRWRSRSRARRTEARLRIRSPSSPDSARVTVSLPTRGRLFGFGPRPAARDRSRLVLFDLFLIGKDRNLARRRQRRHLGRRRLAGALGDFAPRLFLLAPLLLFLGALARFFGRLAPRLFFLGLAPRLFLGAQPRLLGGAFGLLPAAILLGQRRLAPRFLIGALGVLQRPHAPGAFLGGQGARHHHQPPCRFGGGGTRRRRRFALARHRGRRLGLARLGLARPDHPLFADLDGDGFRPAMGKALPDLTGLHTLTQFQPAAGPSQGQGPFLLLLSCVAHRAPICPSPAPARPGPHSPPAPPPHRRESRPISSRQPPGAGLAGRGRVLRLPHGRGRKPHQFPPRSAP